MIKMDYIRKSIYEKHCITPFIFWHWNSILLIQVLDVHSILHGNIKCNAVAEHDDFLLQEFIRSFAARYSDEKARYREYGPDTLPHGYAYSIVKVRRPGTLSHFVL